MVAMILVSPHGWKAFAVGEPPARVPAGTHDAAIGRVGGVAAGNRDRPVHRVRETKRRLHARA